MRDIASHLVPIRWQSFILDPAAISLPLLLLLLQTTVYYVVGHFNVIYVSNHLIKLAIFIGDFSRALQNVEQNFAF